MSPRFVLGRENVPCVAEVVNRSLKADCTDFTTWTCACVILRKPAGMDKMDYHTVPKEIITWMLRKLGEVLKQQ